jgi:hypothetical protein
VSQKLSVLLKPALDNDEAVEIDVPDFYMERWFLLGGCVGFVTGALIGFIIGAGWL